MNNFWLKHYTDSASAHADSPLKQVGKTVNGVEVGEGQIGMIVANIAKVLELTTADKLFDLCCGNGVLTVRLAECAGSVIGIDFTEGLLKVAREQHGRSNLYYRHADILTLSANQLGAANRFMMYEALQHLTPAQFSQLLHILGQQSVGTRFFIGGIPDKRHLHDFYDTEVKFRFYEESEQSGRSHLGRWWLKEEVRELAEQAGFSTKILEQSAGLYTAYYRFDALLEKKK